jgi:hypothetical protein
MAKSKKNQNKAKLNLTVRGEQRNKLEQMASLENRSVSTSTAGSATLIANSGTNGGQGGRIIFENRSTGGTSRVELFGNGSLDISPHQAPGRDDRFH